MSSSLPSTQKAFVLHKLGEWPQLSTSLPVPHPSRGQLLIRLRALGLNALDVKLCEENDLFSLKLPATLSNDFSGEVVAVGEGVKEREFKVGDEVFGLSSFVPIMGVSSEYIAVPSWVAVKKPASLPHELAAALPEAALTAYVSLKQSDLKGKTVFIAGGSGGVGHFAVGLARLLGASKIITAASKPEGIKWLKKESAADAVLNYKEEDVKAAVMKLTDGKGVDVVYDPTYQPSSFFCSASLLAEGGVLNALFHEPEAPRDLKAAAAERKGKAFYYDLGRKLREEKEAIYFSTLNPMLTELAQWVQEGKLKVFVSEVAKFEQYSKLLQKFKENNFDGGKMIVKV